MNKSQQISVGFLSSQTHSIFSKIEDLIDFYYFAGQTHYRLKSRDISCNLSSSDFEMSPGYLPSEVQGVTVLRVSAEVWDDCGQHQMFLACSQVPGGLFPAIYQQFIFTGYSFLLRELWCIVLMIHFEKEFTVALLNFLFLVLIC